MPRLEISAQAMGQPLTIFSIPKPFVGHSAIIQRNAIQSWLALSPVPEVILCGDEIGVAAVAQEFGIRHLAQVQCSQQGTPLLNDVFAQVHQLAAHAVLAYLNADILLVDDFLPSVQQVVAQQRQFLLLGRRWNLELDQPLDFEQSDWQAELRQKLYKQGTWGGIGALDYFVFPKPLFSELPPFAVGRAGWDSWMVSEALRQSYPVINGSQVITAIHQNHDYRHLAGERLEAFHGVEAQHNRTFLQGRVAGNSAHATSYLTLGAGERSSPRLSLVVAAQDNSALSQIQQLEQQSYRDLEILVVGEVPNQTDRESSIVTAWNQGLEQASGELVLFLDGKSCLWPDALAQQIRCFESCQGSLELVLSGWHCGETAVEPWQHLGKLLSGREGLHGFHIWVLPLLWQLLHPSTVLWRRDWLRRLNGFDAVLQPQAAMVDLLLHSASKGGAAMYLEASTLRCEPLSLESQTILQIELEAGQILLHYFEHPHLPAWMYPLRGLADYYLRVWLGWLMYQASDFAQMSRYLEQSLPYAARISDAILDWPRQFERFAEATQQRFDRECLTQSPDWQQLIRRLLAEAGGG